MICQKIDDEIYQSQTYHFSKIPPTNYSFTFILPISIAFRMLSYIQRQEEFSVPAIQCTYTYKENYTQGTSILVFANRANKSSPANNCVLLQTKLGGIGDFFDLFDRKGIYRSTLSKLSGIGCRLVDKASCCRNSSL